MRRTAAVLLFLCACAPTLGTRRLPGLPPGVTVADAEQPYDVLGNSVQTIGRSLQADSRAALGSGAWGRHRWDIRWTWSYSQDGPICRITDVSIDLTSTIWLPQWTGRESADSVLVGTWDTFISGLRSHEYCHRVLAYHAARDIHRQLRDLEGSSCGLLGSQANAKAQTIVTRQRRLNEEYDQLSRGWIRWPPDPTAGEPPECPVW